MRFTRLMFCFLLSSSLMGCDSSSSPDRAPSPSASSSSDDGTEGQEVTEGSQVIVVDQFGSLAICRTSRRWPLFAAPKWILIATTALPPAKPTRY